MSDDKLQENPGPPHEVDGGLGTGTKHDPAKAPEAQPKKQPATPPAQPPQPPKR